MILRDCERDSSNLSPRKKAITKTITEYPKELIKYPRKAKTNITATKLPPKIHLFLIEKFPNAPFTL
jgi:hypothetical protein